MKIPKKVKRFCPHCKKSTEHKVSNVSSGGKRSELKRGGTSRLRMRGLRRGLGSLGRFSKPPIAKWKRKTKSTKKTNLKYTCSVCSKAHMQKKGIRSGKIIME